jgi:predicted TIM-barrel fold metal-dependent hydrolase
MARRCSRYLLDELMADLGAGHNVRATVFVQCRAMYRAEGPEHLKPLGEVEFANGAAAMSASGAYGEVRACAGIVGFADFTWGEDRVGELLDAAQAAADGRFKGVRQMAPWDPDPAVAGAHAAPPGLYGSDMFRQGCRALAARGLSFDAFVLEPQLPEAVALARAFPDVQFIVDHLGTPLGYASYEGQREARFDAWRRSMGELAGLPNVAVKLGGLGMHLVNFPSLLAEPPAGSAQLAQEWRPYVEAAVEAFGPQRAMFESNYPVDSVSGDYRAIWNAFKRIAARWSQSEKAALFHDTAQRVYRLG